MCLGLCSFIIAKEWFAMFIKMFGKLNSDYTSFFLPIMAKVQMYNVETIEQDHPR